MGALWLTVSLLSANVVAVSRAPDGRGAVIHLEGTVAAPPWAVEQVVRDVGRYPEWFPTMRSATPLKAGVYDAVFQLPWPLKTLCERLEFVRSRTPGTVVIRWRQVSGDFARDEGRWTLTPAGPNHTTVRYDAVLQFRHWVPTWLIRRAEQRAAPHILSAIEQRASLLNRTASR